MPEPDGAIEDGKLSSSDILAMLDDESDDDTSKDDTSKDDTSKNDADMDEDVDSEEDDEDSDEDEADPDDDDSEDGKDDEEDELSVNTPPRRKEILKEFPTLFKKFPQLETAWFRDREFVDLFGTLDDAKESLQKAETLDGYESSLMTGDTESILKAVKDNDETAWNKVVDNYLTTLAKVDQNAHMHVLTGVAKNIISHAAQEKDDKLTEAVTVLHKYLFGNTNFQPHQNLSKDNSGREELEQERQEMMQERFETARDDLSVRVHNSLKGTVDTLIDPKGSMSSFVKKHAINEAMSDLESSMRDDKNFMKSVDGLWKKAATAKYNAESISRIRSMFTSKAKTLLSDVVKRSRREALKGSGRGRRSRSSDDDTGQRNSERKGLSNSSSGKKSKDGAGMSTYDYLNSD